MRRVYFFIISMFLFVGCASVQPKEAIERNPSAYGAAEPRLYIKQAPIFDMLCQQTPFKIDSTLQQKLRSELNEKLDRFQAEWIKNASALIPASELAAGRRFSRKEFSVAFVLCGWTPMGDPAFIVSALPYLGEVKKVRGFDLPLSMRAFVSMTHHELLHSLVDNIENAEFSNSSTLLEKYNKESYNVLVHLHLMAIQKASYQKLNDSDLIQETQNLYNFIGGDYKRAWEIVGIEGTEKFLKELQSFNARKK